MSIYPLHFFTQPFCEAGDKTIPTDVPPAEGRTSLPLGFPPETQKPIRDGGIAPDRWDFNGILYMLSALAYWQQAGGQWKYDPSFPYEPPSFCYYGDQLWYCIGENGPGTKHAAPVAPGTDTTYWVDLLWFIAGKKYCSRTGNTIRLTGDYVTGTGTIDEAGECSFSPVVHQSDQAHHGPEYQPVRRRVRSCVFRRIARHHHPYDAGGVAAHGARLGEDDHPHQFPYSGQLLHHAVEWVCMGVGLNARSRRELPHQHCGKHVHRVFRHQRLG